MQKQFGKIPSTITRELQDDETLITVTNNNSHSRIKRNVMYCNETKLVHHRWLAMTGLTWAKANYNWLSWWCSGSASDS